jgi:hypothetical protein
MGNLQAKERKRKDNRIIERLGHLFEEPEREDATQSGRDGDHSRDLPQKNLREVKLRAGGSLQVHDRIEEKADRPHDGRNVKTSRRTGKIQKIPSTIYGFPRKISLRFPRRSQEESRGIDPKIDNSRI